MHTFIILFVFDFAVILTLEGNAFNNCILNFNN